MSVSAARGIRVSDAVALAASPAVVAKATAEGVEASCEKFFRPFDMHGYRRRFPDLWATFLKQHFNGDVQLIAFMFSVSERTAKNWLASIGSPRPEFVLKAVRHIPAAQMLLEAA